MVFIIQKILSVITAFCLLVSWPVFGNFKKNSSPVNPDECNLNFAVISDTHMKDEFIRQFMVELGLSGMEKSDSRLDALVVSGDLTDHGEADEWNALAESFSKYDPANEIILACGNHDTWTDESFDKAKENFIEYNGIISGREISEMYYTTEINGYTFVVLGSETDRTAAYFSPEQLEWLDKTMAEKAEAGKPIFVVSHWPINESHGLPETWGDSEPEPDDGGIGDESDAVENILKQYDNVFMISGHLHNGIGDKATDTIWSYTSVESDGSFHSINLPAYTYFNARGQVINGNGFNFEVYDDEVIIRARSYTADVWYTSYEYSIPLV